MARFPIARRVIVVMGTNLLVREQNSNRRTFLTSEQVNAHLVCGHVVSKGRSLWDRRGRMPSMKSLINSLGLEIFYDQNSAHSKESIQTIYQESNASAYVMVRLYLAWTWNILRPEFCPFERIDTNNISGI
jgi:hypothetical protein